MKIIKPRIQYYLDLLQNLDYFALAGYSDAEWFCVTKSYLGTTTGFGQILDGATGERLADILQRRNKDPNFKIAIPDCFWLYKEGVYSKLNKQIDKFVQDHHLVGPWYERDSITDNLAENAGLSPFIKQFQKMSVVIIGNQALKDLDFLSPQKFIGVPSPNCHMELGAIEKAIDQALGCSTTFISKGPTVYLVSAGVSSPLIIDGLYSQIPNNFFIDCGSIWDAFVGIGGQRTWRAKLYENPTKLQEWKRLNLERF